MKSMGGTNNKENLVMLTAREHFLAHWLLWRIHRNKQSAYAFSMMCNPGKSGKRKIISSMQGKIGRAARFNSNIFITEYKIVENFIFSYLELKDILPEWKAKKRILSEETKKKIGLSQPKTKLRNK